MDITKEPREAWDWNRVKVDGVFAVAEMMRRKERAVALRAARKGAK